MKRHVRRFVWLLILSLQACATSEATQDDPDPPDSPARPVEGGVRDVSLDVQIVDGSTDAQAESGPVPSPNDPAAISAGYEHNCALTRAGKIRCWGGDVVGELGDGLTAERAAPGPPVAGISGALQVAAMHYSTCALLADRTVSCWGTMTDGQLGDDVLPGPHSVLTPTAVPGVTNVRAVGGGGHTCVVLQDLTVKCWGFNKSGQVGYSTMTYCDPAIPPEEDPSVCSATPTLVPGVGNITQIALGEQHTCALTDVGTVRCWGYNAFGQLGDGTLDDSIEPRDVPGLSDTVQISAGLTATCALRKTGEVVCWGAKPTPALAGVPTPVPYTVTGFSGSVASVECGEDHACARMTDGTVQCWGRNFNGSLGNPSLPMLVIESPTTVPGLTNVTQLALGGSNACAIRDDATIWCWGGVGSSYQTSPTKVAW